MIASPRREPCPPPERNVGLESYLLNELNMVLVAAWAFDEREIVGFFAGDDELQSHPALLAEITRLMNGSLVRITMLQLSRQALRTQDSFKEQFTLRKLARSLDEKRIPAMERKLRRHVLPVLARAGFIEGFEKREKWSTKGHRICITERGLEAQTRYLNRCATLCAPLFAELRDVR